MRCDDIQWLLSAHADGELSPRQSARVADHLRSCPACAAESRSLERLVSALTALPEEEPPPYLRASIYSALEVVLPTPWQRLFGAILPLHPARVLAAGAAAAGLVVLGLTAVPLQRDEGNRPLAVRLAYDMPTRPIVTPAPVTPTAHPSLSEPIATPAPQTVPPAPEPAVMVEVPDPARNTSLTHPPQPASQPPHRAATVSLMRGSSKKTGTRRSAPPPASTFDPLAPVLEPTGSPNSPSMPNVVVADTLPSTPQPDPATVVASMPSDTDMASTNAEPDDLAALRQRLAQEQLQIPPVRLEPRRPKPKSIPILRGDF